MIYLIESYLQDDLKILEYEMIFNYWISQIIDYLDINHKDWPGKKKQEIIYNISK